MAEFRLMVWFLWLNICSTYATDFNRRVRHISQQNMADFILISIAFHYDCNGKWYDIPPSKMF
jgi:hypothetical protein